MMMFKKVLAGVVFAVVWTAVTVLSWIDSDEIRRAAH